MPGPLPPPAPLGPEGLPPGYPFRPDWEVTPRWYVQQLNQPGEPPLLIDCRRPEEWNVARIEGALLIPLHELVQRIDEVRDALGPHARPIVIHCHTGRRSLQAASILRGFGFDRAFSMAGGIELWSIDIDPSVPRY